MIPDLLSSYRPQVYTAPVSSTPLAVFSALYRREACSFLYESLKDGERRGDYSFLGGRPQLLISSFGTRTELAMKEKTISVHGDPLEILRELNGQVNPAEGIAPFAGGALGYISYDAVRGFEAIPDRHYLAADTPDLQFMFPGECIIFNHKKETVTIILFSEDGAGSRMDTLKNALHTGLEESAAVQEKTVAKDIFRHTSKKSFCTSVTLARDYIRKGEVFQTVLSQRISFTPAADALDIYTRLRKTNPSPYMYCLNLNERQILGSSPEVLVSCTGEKAVTRPLAGTRPRTGIPEKDRALAAELLADDKERAEHIMLVDLSRNDLGRVCRPGTVTVPLLMDVEQHSRVMHIVSQVEGRLRSGCDAFDLFRACFPAGTVSGAPKVRAMEIIDELETVRRGIYAGAIGYFSADGSMDMCIAIRAICLNSGRGFVQAGAGIVADSDPEKEYEETYNKAAALLEALGVEEPA